MINFLSCNIFIFFYQMEFCLKFDFLLFILNVICMISFYFYYYFVSIIVNMYVFFKMVMLLFLLLFC